MLIKSQDGKKLTQNINLKVWHDSCDSKMWQVSNEIVGELGRYSTEEKAVKVLNMVSSAYDNIQYMKFIGRQYGEAFDSVFTMPQDDEI